MAHRRGHCQAVARTKYEPNVSCGSDGRAHSLLETALSSHDAPSSREGRRLESPALQRGYPLRAIPGAFDLRACRLGDIRHEQPTLTDAQIPPPLWHHRPSGRSKSHDRLIRAHHPGYARLSSDSYPSLAGTFSYHRSSHSGPSHSYHRYRDPLFTTRSTSCRVRPHFGHSGSR